MSTPPAKSPITTHALDTALGRPVAGMGVELARLDATGAPTVLGVGFTNDDGRAADLMRTPLEPGVYRLRFDTAGYFAATGRETFFPRATVEFTVTAGREHYHVPLLVSPFGYSTYRGS
ncbi:MAG: hydroxyisourate hydrolase [Lacipirellulaceae bacterium]